MQTPYYSLLFRALHANSLVFLIISYFLHHSRRPRPQRLCYPSSASIFHRCCHTLLNPCLIGCRQKAFYIELYCFATFAQKTNTSRIGRLKCPAPSCFADATTKIDGLTTSGAWRPVSILPPRGGYILAETGPST